jgi:hypothetical protein
MLLPYLLLTLVISVICGLKWLNATLAVMNHFSQRLFGVSTALLHPIIQVTLASAIITLLWLPIVLLLGFRSAYQWLNAIQSEAEQQCHGCQACEFETGHHTSAPEYDGSEDQGPGAYRA